MSIIPKWLRSLVVLLCGWLKAVISLFFIRVESIISLAGQDSTAAYFENARKILDFSLELTGIIATILGINYIRDIRQKQREATFSFLSKLRVRLDYLESILKTYKSEFLDSLSRTTDDEIKDKNPFSQQKMCDLEEWCENTLQFLRDEENQYPAAKGWSAHLCVLIDFLSVCKNISNKEYYYWDDGTNDEEKNAYYNYHVNNIREMTQMISDLQYKMENVLFPTHH